MVLGLTGGETVLLVVALVFIVFALVVSMYVPRFRPDFPGDRVGLFVFVAVLLFAAMATAVVTTAGGEEHGEEAAHTESGPGETEPGETEPGETEPGETEPAETETSGGGGGGGDAAGEQVFATAGCGGCHVLEAAGTSGSVGPNLDDSKPSVDLVIERVTEGSGAMPSFSDELSDEQIRDVAAYVVKSTSG